MGKRQTESTGNERRNESTGDRGKRGNGERGNGRRIRVVHEVHEARGKQGRGTRKRGTENGEREAGRLREWESTDGVWDADANTNGEWGTKGAGRTPVNTTANTNTPTSTNVLTTRIRMRMRMRVEQKEVRRQDAPQHGAGRRETEGRANGKGHANGKRNENENGNERGDNGRGRRGRCTRERHAETSSSQEGVNDDDDHHHRRRHHHRSKDARRTRERGYVPHSKQEAATQNVSASLTTLAQRRLAIRGGKSARRFTRVNEDLPGTGQPLSRVAVNKNGHLLQVCGRRWRQRRCSASRAMLENEDESAEDVSNKHWEEERRRNESTNQGRGITRGGRAR